MTNARRRGQVLGTQGVENYFRVPYGPGWALAGDAGYCKDLILGQGIGDALLQAFLLDEALGDVFAGADWDASMRTYQERRDTAVMLLYQAAVAYAGSTAVPAGSIGWLRAMLGNPWYARSLAMAMPVVATSSDVLPDRVRPLLEVQARAFGIHEAVAGAAT